MIKHILLAIFCLMMLKVGYPQYSITIAQPGLYREIHNYKKFNSNIELNLSRKLNKTFTIKTKYVHSYLTENNKLRFSEANTLFSHKRWKFQNELGIDYVNFKDFKYPCIFRVVYKVNSRANIDFDIINFENFKYKEFSPQLKLVYKIEHLTYKKKRAQTLFFLLKLYLNFNI